MIFGATGVARPLVIWGRHRSPFFLASHIRPLWRRWAMERKRYGSSGATRGNEVSQRALHKTDGRHGIAANAVDLALWTWTLAAIEVRLLPQKRELSWASLHRKSSIRNAFGALSILTIVTCCVMAVKNSLQTDTGNPVAIQGGAAMVNSLACQRSVLSSTERKPVLCTVFVRHHGTQACRRALPAVAKRRLPR